MIPVSDQIYSLKNRTVWVIGGAGYLGQPTVLLLHSLGATVVCCDVNGKAAAFVEKAGIQQGLTGVDIDMSSEEAIKMFVAEQINKGGVPYGLVDLTYASTAKKMEELSGADFNKVNQAITHTFLLAREVGTQMAIRGEGSIVLFSSMYGNVAPYPAVYEGLNMNVNPVEYGAGKAAIIQLTKYLSVHWGLRNIRCNCISPGPFPSPAVQEQHPEFIKRLSEKVPLGRVGRNYEISGVVAFLLADASSFITGQNLLVDGGWTAW